MHVSHTAKVRKPHHCPDRNRSRHVARQRSGSDSGGARTQVV